MAVVGSALNRFTGISGIGGDGHGIRNADVLKGYIGLSPWEKATSQQLEQEG